jgi:formiminotetrahydrofolate cyclodeaminase
MTLLKRLLERLLRRGPSVRVPHDRSEGVREMLAKTSLEEFTAKLASGAPTPGGGSAAAMAGALSASLIQMVCDLTLGRDKYRAHDESVRRIRQKAEAMHRNMLALVDRDADAYDGVMAAIRMPKGTEREKAARREAMGRANLFATETPMATAEGCVTLLGLAGELVGKSNTNALSDVGTAAMLAYAGLRGGAMNVRINLSGIVDAGHAARARERVQRIEVEGEKLREESLRAVFAAGSLQ